MNAARLVFLNILLALACAETAKGEVFPLSIIHINDFHARYEPTDKFGGTCDPGEDCIGGYARTVFTVKRLMKEQQHQNPLYFNAGDSFQGTLWYNIGRWNVTSQFLNILPADAMTLGNHEFDHGVEGVVPFLENINTSMLVANMDSSLEPTMNGKYKRSVILERNKRKIGVIGVILETTDNLANTGNLIFRNESDAIKDEAAKLRREGANIIIVISHCGYDVDKVIATQAGLDIDVIVGAHSHTFLFTGDNPPGPDTPRGDYPTIRQHENGHRVLILQAGAYAKYVGNITVFFDDDGEVVDYEGAPLFMGANVPEDAEVKKALQPWKEIIDVEGNRIVGETKVNLEKAPCSSGECNLGNFFCDAMIHSFAGLHTYQQKSWTNVSIGLINTGALRVPLLKGNLSYAHLVTMSPFENTLMAFDLPGNKLIEALEYSVKQVDLESNVTASSVFLQVSGLLITYNLANQAGERVVDVKVRCASCQYPRYEPLDYKRAYRIVAPNFLVNGGDGFKMFRDHGTAFQEEMTDLDALLVYMESINPVFTGIEKRIKIQNSQLS